MILQFYRKPAYSVSKTKQILSDSKNKLGLKINELFTEWCYYIQISKSLTKEEEGKLQWLLSETFKKENFDSQSFLSKYPTVLEVGPRLNFETAWSTTAVSICHNCGLNKVLRLERSIRFGLPIKLNDEQKKRFLTPLYDRMTQIEYKKPLESFETGLKPAPVRIIPIIEKGSDVLLEINKEMGFGWDEQDVQMIFDLFSKTLKRNPTDVELFQLAQANSEHSRHHFFKGKLIIDGKPAPSNLIQIIKTPWQKNKGNSLIAFCDDSSAISGKEIKTIMPSKPGEHSAFVFREKTYHPTLTAETHNFPSGVAPYPGAATGTGGRIRDNQVVGRGGLVVAGGAAYCVGNLHIKDYNLSWEKDGWVHPNDLASPLEILIQASNGASDYGNCFGEPVIYGFTRSFGLNLFDGYRSWYKPIMYTVGAGQIDNDHISKGKPEAGMLVVQVGGPAYRIGLGGGAASSMIQGENVLDLDFNAVQRGDPQMEQRMNRLFRSCIEMGKDNPIITSHDLGAGGDCNALPEIVDPAGAKINLRSIPLGDQSLSVLEYWGNESQERNAILVWPKEIGRIKEICGREGIPCAVVGEVTSDGNLVLFDEKSDSSPVNLPLDKVLGDIPPKTFNLERIEPKLKPLKLEKINLRNALDLVLRLPQVGSKRFLTTKVDRSVTGLIAQQQCIGPNQLTLSDYAVIAQSHFGLSGVALSLGEQPIKGLISPGAMARMSVAEALLNIVGAKITNISDIKCSANWMLAAKQPGEGVWLFDAARALRDILIDLSIAIDGGKDSLSMAAKAKSPDENMQIVKAPGELVIANYAPMEDITCKVTCDLKKSGNTLLFIDLSCGKSRLGGSALAQVYGEIGDESPDVCDTGLLKHTFEVIQVLIEQGLIFSVHDRSDGGLVVTLLEMAFAGNVGLKVELESKDSVIETLFNEELGLVLECENPKDVTGALVQKKVPVQNIGKVGPKNGNIKVSMGGQKVLDEKMTILRQIWEETSSKIDELQANPECVREEIKVNSQLVKEPPYKLTFDPKPTSEKILSSLSKPKVAILREQGSNGDREMASAFFLAGFESYDITMTDLLSSSVRLEDFRGIAFVGGFSFADVLDSGKGWAGVIHFNKGVFEQFDRFYKRPDTFSLGVCNGCQLMALLGWIPWYGLSIEKQPRFIHNKSERFESRFTAVKIMPSSAIMLRGMIGSTLGVWVAHGEGQLHIPDARMLQRIQKEKLVPLRFVDTKGDPTTIYPFNPNGSPEGITALCSPDGRHLAMMPHPERTFLLWQWPWLPKEWKNLKASPWLRLFQNAFDWCVNRK